MLAPLRGVRCSMFEARSAAIVAATAPIYGLGIQVVLPHEKVHLDSVRVPLLDFVNLCRKPCREVVQPPVFTPGFLLACSGASRARLRSP